MIVTVVIPSERMQCHRLDGSDRLCAMFICSAFAMHRVLHGWRVTHVPSGRKFMDFENLLDAVYCAGALMGTGYDWAALTGDDQVTEAALSDAYQAAIARARELLGDRWRLWP